MLAILWRRPRIFVLVLAADVASDGLASLGKYVTDRHRPFEHRLGPPVSSSSFPSGHSATSFACATVLAAFAPRLRVPLFALAALIAISRLYNGVHYPTDVLAGAALGAVTALLLLAGARLRSRRAPRSG